MKTFIKTYPDDIEKYGAENAIILGLIDGWVNYNKSIDHKEIDGNYWSGYLTVGDISKQTGIPYKTIQRRMNYLKTNGIVIHAHFGKVSFDKRRWYMRNTEVDNLSIGVDNLSIGVDNLSIKVDKLGDTITNISTNISKEISNKNIITSNTGAIEKIVDDLKRELRFGEMAVKHIKKQYEDWSINIPKDKDNKLRYEGILKLKELEPSLFN